jgi:alpha-tubulin suppressor-like RCC1 family protein
MKNRFRSTCLALTGMRLAGALILVAVLISLLLPYPALADDDHQSVAHVEPAMPADAPSFATISAGSNHTCALNGDGGALCWGANTNGQLGNGSIINRNVPVSVSGLDNGVSDIQAGGSHTCALTTGGGVKCWGHNGFGQLGDNTTLQRTTPVNVSTLGSGVSAIAVGGNHTCALVSGGVKCWGDNAYGQLGDSTNDQRLVPVNVTGLSSGVLAIAAGSSHTCALITGGAVKCWGYNFYGQLGDNSTSNRNAPVDVSTLSGGIDALDAGGGHTCALTTDGGVKCWGYNLYGQLGDTSTTNRPVPVNVDTLSSGIEKISTGGNHTCALSTGGGVKCWGNNEFGQIGDDSTTNRTSPVDVNDLTSGVEIISAGGEHSCVLVSGSGQCWGRNNSGQLGIGVFDYRVTPVGVIDLTSGVSKVSAGGEHTCALTSTGGVKCWGSNSLGQLGDSSTIQRNTPVNVSGLTSGVSAIATGSSHSCALLSSTGGVKCWGYNFYGQLGDSTNTNHSAPVDVSGLTSGVTAIAANGDFTCALTTGGAVKCWGRNNNGQLGDDSIVDRNAPVIVSGLLSGISKISLGGNHACALTTGGGVKCWGDNAFGQLGDNSTSDRHIPVDVSGLLSGVSAISLGGNHTCALTTGGGMKCWGSNTQGQLGDNSIVQRNAPVDVSGLTNGVSAIAAGGSHTCALTTSGGAKCWGYNLYGQVGDATTSDRRVAVNVNGLTSGVAALAGGSNHTCAITAAGALKCWGKNFYGQLGNGEAGFYTEEQNVLMWKIYSPLISR